MNSGGLMRLWAHSLWMRLCVHFGQHVFFAVSFAAVGSLFFYIFSDFFSHQLPTLRPELKDQANLWFCYGLSSLTSVLLLSRIRVENLSRDSSQLLEAHEVTLSLWSYRYGQDQPSIQMFKALRSVCVSMAGGLCCYLIATGLFCISADDELMYWQIFHVMLMIVAAVMGVYLDRHTMRIFKSSPRSEMSSGLWERVWSQMLSAQISAVASWKCQLMWWSYPPSRILLRLMFWFQLFSIIIALVGGSWLEILSVLWLASLVGGYGIFAFEAQAAGSSLYDKLAGVSHREYLMAISLVVTGVVLRVSGVAAVILGGCVITDIMSASMAVKIGMVSVLPFVLVPSFLFQVDVRRPLLNTLMMVMASLFLGTALLAHMGFIVLVVVLVVASWLNCDNRFHRA